MRAAGTGRYWALLQTASMMCCKLEEYIWWLSVLGQDVQAETRGSEESSQQGQRGIPLWPNQSYFCNLELLIRENHKGLFLS